MDALLADILEGLQWDDPEDGRLALKATLSALRDELAQDQVEEIARWLPSEVQKLYCGRPRPSPTPRRLHLRSHFLARIEGHFKDEGVDPEAIARTVCTALCRHRPEAADWGAIVASLPGPLEGLWL